MKPIFFLASLFFAISLQGFGQLSVNSTVTPPQMVSMLAGAGVTITNITYTGSDACRGSFDGTNSNIGLRKGIMLASGKLITAVGPNNQFGAGTNENLPGDPDLAPFASNLPTYDASILEFDFVPLTSVLSFRYVFASEEYPSDTNIFYNDAFAFFISGPGISGKKNIALVPFTSDNISIKNVNGSKNAAYYINNTPGPTVEYDGFTTVLEARATVQPGQTYHMKLTIADTQDGIYDSGVFFEEGSLVSPFAGPDFMVCSGDSIQVQSSPLPGFTTYSWSPAAGLSDPNSVNPKFSAINNSGSPVTQGYRITATNGAGASIIDSLFVTINPLPSASISVLSPPCVGDTINISYGGSDPGDISGFTWNFGGGSLVSGSGQGPYKVIWNSTGIRKLKLNVTASTGCKNKDSVFLNINPLPIISTSVSPGTVCPATAVTLSASGASTYKWARASSPSVTESATSSHTVYPSATTAYIVTAKDNNSCRVSSLVPVPVFPPCTAQIQLPGNDSICLGSSATLAGTGTASSFKWFETTDPSTVKGTANTYIYDTKISGFPASNPIGFIVEGTDNNGCTGKDTIKIYVRPLPQVEGFKSRDSICPGDSVQLLGRGGIAYAWFNKISPGVILNNPGDSVAWVSPSFTSTYVIKGTDRFLCESPDTIEVFVRPSPLVSILTATDTICRGSGTVLSGGGAQNYSWSLLSTPGNVFSTNKNIVVSPVQPTYYLLSGTSQYGCRNSDTLLVYVRDLPAINASANPAQLCPGFSSTLQGSGGSDYLWANILNPAAYISNDSALRVSPSVSATYILSGTDRYGCSNKDTLGITLKNKPFARRIIGSAYVCPGLSDVVYRITDTIPGFPVSSSAFAWSMINGSPSSGQALNRDSLKINFASAPGIAKIRAIETNPEGCPGDTLLFNIEIKSIFTPPAPLGNMVICSKDRTGQLYTTPFNTAGSTYTWHVEGGNVLSGNGTPLASVEWNVPGSGKIWFEENSVTASANCYGLSDTLYVTIKATPDPGPIRGATSLCPRNTPYFVNSHPGSVYQWSLNRGTILSGSGTSQIISQWTDQGADTLSLVETGANGCVADPVKLAIQVNPAPVINELSGSNELCESDPVRQYIALTSTAGTSGFSWTVQNGSVIGEANNDTVLIRWKVEQDLPRSISVIEISKDSCPSQPFGKIIRLSSNNPYITSVSCLKERSAVEVNWISGSLSNSYNLYRRNYQETISDTSWVLIRKDLYTPYYVDTQAFSEARSYQYRYSTLACGDTMFSKPGNSILLRSAYLSQSRIRLEWNNYNNWKEKVAGYEIWKKTDQETEYSYVMTTGLDTSAELSTTAGFTHCFALRALERNSSATSWSNKLCIETPHPVNIPSAFSPNGDGLNDVWVIRNIESYPGSVMEVFNRWGEKVLSKRGYKNNWGGTFNGRELPDATYFYIIHLGEAGREQKNMINGTVTITR